MLRWLIGLLGMSIALAACGGKVASMAGAGTGQGEACYLPDGTDCPSGTWCDQADTCERCFCDDASWSCEDVPCGASTGMQDAGSGSGSDSGSGSECDIPSNGCDFCGNVTCPSGASLDSACRCLADDYTYVTPISQTCDFCCGKTCEPGQFLDFECSCY